MSQDAEPVGTSPPPGPPALHGDNPTPPPLENGPGWEAAPLLVGGADAYDDGEYLYQDYVYDDHGADTRPFLAPPAGDRLGGLYSQPTGDYCYPDDPARYAYNAADLLEFRARPTGDGVAYRLTLNTMREPDAAAVAIGIDTSGSGDPDGGRTDWGYGLGDLGAPVDHVIVTWGTGAELDGDPLADERVEVAPERNQITVEVPLDPGEDTWRHYVGVGLWEPADGAFRQVAAEADAARPGGAPQGENRGTPPLFNVGFRFDEPVNPEPLTVANVGRKLVALATEQPRNVLGRLGASSGLFGGDALGLFAEGSLTDLEDGPLATIAGGNPLGLLGDDASFRVLGEGNWRDHRQATALAERDISPFHADVDFGRLRAGAIDRDLDLTGLQTFLYPSRYDFGAGVDPENNVLEGPIQPYAAYVPTDGDDGPRSLTVLLPSLGGCYNQYPVYTRRFVESLADDHGSVVLMPEARGPGRWFKREAEVDVFEAWRDLDGRVDVDRDRVGIAGYSMGGYGTLMYAAKYPDLFARAFAIGGPPSDDPLEGLTRGVFRTPALVTEGLFGGQGGGVVLSIFTGDPEDATRITDNLRHVQPLLWHGAADPLVPALSPLNYADRLGSLGYRYRLDVFPHEHLLLALTSDWDRGASFLAAGQRMVAPARVTYRHVPAFAHPDLDLVHDGAYWVSDVSARADADSALVDATSLADGYGEPSARTVSGSGTSPGPHRSRGIEWGEPEEVRGPANALEVTLEGVSSATLWVADAGLDAGEPIELDVDSDGEATLTLAGTDAETTVEVAAGRHRLEVEPLR